MTGFAALLSSQMLLAMRLTLLSPQRPDSKVSIETGPSRSVLCLMYEKGHQVLSRALKKTSSIPCSGPSAKASHTFKSSTPVASRLNFQFLLQAGEEAMRCHSAGTPCLSDLLYHDYLIRAIHRTQHLS
ncbi:hypothetical protein GGS21DRAFT_13112 [Xylaria nigripes]|nr:hypothetical protein GGS21DRAFT_13112 [Xylaria nigripes]